MKYDIIPELKEVKLLGKKVNIADYSLTDEYKRLVPVAEETLSYFGVKLSGDKKIVATENNALKDGEYTLTIAEDEIAVTYSGFNGAYYGVVTMAQLAQKNKNVLTTAEIHDYPDLSFRAVSDDISRGQVSTMENFKSIIRRLSYWKYNVYLPYIEDTFDLKCVNIGKEDYALDRDEWAELCAYAKNYGITVRPLIELLCHFKMGELQEFKPYVLRYPNGNLIGGCLDPLAPNVRDILGKVLDELVEAFGTGIIHAGCDEVSILEEIYGKERAEELFCMHANMLNEEITKRGCTMMMYGDMFYPGGGQYAYGFDALKRLNKDIQIVYWAYWSSKKYPEVKRLTDDGWTTIVSPAARSYGRFYPTYITYENIRYICNDATPEVDSLVVSSWNDDGAILREENMQAFATGGEFGWNRNSTRSFESLLKEFIDEYFCFESYDLKPFDDVYHFEKYLDPMYEVNTICELSMYTCWEFWRKWSTPTNSRLELHKVAPMLYDLFEKSLEYFKTLKPMKNAETYECFLFDMARMTWAFKKASILPSEAIEEEKIKELVKAHPEMIEEHKRLHRENERLWFMFSRRSEWDKLDRKYSTTENYLEEMMK